MKNRIAIHLEDQTPTENTLVTWALLNAEGQSLLQGQSPLGRVRALAGRAGDKAEVFVFVTGFSVMLTEVDIPSRQAAHLRKALPFMMEDQLASDLRQTHLAVAPNRYGDSVPVAVVSHEQMIKWLDCLHKAALVPDAVIPEQLLLSREPGSISVHIHGQRALLRLGDCRGASVALENLPLILELALSRRAMPCNRIEISACISRADDLVEADRLGKEMGETLDRPIWRTNYKETLLEILNQSSRGPLPVFNLCQGGYRVDARSGQGKNSWLVAWATAAACVLLLGLVSIGAGIFMQSRADTTHSETIAMFRRMFPDERRVINLRRQAEHRLASPSAAGSGALALMASLASSLGSGEITGTALQALNYESGSATLAADLNAPSLAQIDRLSQVLNQSGISAKVLSASEEGGTARARLELRSE